MRFNLQAVGGRYADVGAALGVAHDARAAIEAVEKLSATVGTDRRLAEFGAKAADIDALATDALRDMLILNTPRHPSREEVRGLYALAM